MTFDRLSVEKSKIPKVSVVNSLWPTTNEIAFKAMGHPEVANEFASLVTERSQIEARLWDLELRKHLLEDIDVLYAIHLVELTIKYAKPEWGVGGPVDVAELIPGRDIVWIRCKTECIK
jgi:hypothetical protein